VRATEAKLRVAKDLDLPAQDFIESKSFIVGQSGRGKSGLLKVLEEELVENMMPFVVFDPAGVAWGIRSSLDGKGPGLPVLIIGGPYGDVPLDRRAGAETARTIVQANISAIIDFSEEPKAAYLQFLTDFAETLYSINDTSRLIVIDEAREVLPQRILPDMTRTYHAVERLVRQGRNKGIGVCLVSQRFATVNKDVVTQCGTLFIFGLVGKPDHKTMHEWVEEWSTEDELNKLESGLAALKPRECWVWSPQQFDLFQHITVREFRTLHPDRTYLRKMGLLATKPVTTDVKHIVDKLGKEMEKLSKAKAETVDAKKLSSAVEWQRRENVKLKEQLDALRKQRMTSPAMPTMPKPEVVEKLRKELQDVRSDNAQWKKVFEHQARLLRRARSATELLIAIAEEAKSSGIVTKPQGKVYASVPKPGQMATHLPPDEAAVQWRIKPGRKLSVAPSPRSESKEVVAEVDITGTFAPMMAHLKILSALAQLHGIGIEEPSKVQLALWSGYSPNGGGYNNYLGAMRSAGLITYPLSGAVELTDAGRALLESADRIPEIPSTPEELHEQVFRMVGESKARILRVLISAYPDGIPKAELAERCDPPFSPDGGGFNNYCGSLRSMGLIEYTREGVVATPYLFLEA
jgi:hypothetical protein